MKKLIALVAVLFIFFATMTSVSAASVTLSDTKVEAGESITVSGKAQADSDIVVKVTDEDGNIVFFNAVRTDASGTYSSIFRIPSDTDAGKLTVTAGSGSDVASTLMTVNKTATPSTPSTPVAPTTPATDDPATSEGVTNEDEGSDVQSVDEDKEDEPIDEDENDEPVDESDIPAGEQDEQEKSGLGWIWIIVGLAVIGIAVFVIRMLKKRSEDEDR